MKKILSLLLVVIMTISLLVGCAGSDDTTSSTSTETENTKKADDKKDDTSSADASDGPITFPLEETVKLTVFVHTRPNVDDFDTNLQTEHLEEMMNIDLEFVVATENDAQEKLNLMLATGDYPDLLLTSQLSSAQQALYGGQGTLIPLNDLINDNTPNIKRIMEDNPNVKNQITMPDGNIYNLPSINDCYHCKSTQKLWIYQPWLDALGLDMPTTTDEFYAVMKAFATEDPNGNGEADEIPLAGAIKGWKAQVEGFLMNAFVYHPLQQSGAERLFVDNGTVVPSYTQEGWKDGLKYLQMLRQEGLLAEESFTQAQDGIKQMGENPDDVILGAFPGGSVGVATDMSATRWRDYVSVPALEGPSGQRTMFWDAYSGVSPAFSITDTCEYPEVAMALADYLYTEEMSLNSTVGPKGVAWDYVTDESLKGLDGNPAVWENLVPLAEQDPNLMWNQMANAYKPSTLRLGRYNEDPKNIEVVLYQATKDNYVPYYPDIDTILPPLVLTEAQSAELLSYSTSINDYVKEMIAEFIVTDIDIDANWDSYLEELDAMGLEIYLGVYQEAYDSAK